MKDAGCIAVWFGVEAGSQMVIDAMGKGYKLETIKKSFKTGTRSRLNDCCKRCLRLPRRNT